MIKIGTKELISVNSNIEHPIAVIIHPHGVLCEYEKNDPTFYFDLQTALQDHGYLGYSLCVRLAGHVLEITELGAMTFPEEELFFRDNVMVMLGNIEEEAA